MTKNYTPPTDRPPVSRAEFEAVLKVIEGLTVPYLKEAECDLVRRYVEQLEAEREKLADGAVRLTLRWQAAKLEVERLRALLNDARGCLVQLQDDTTELAYANWAGETIKEITAVVPWPKKEGNDADS